MNKNPLRKQAYELIQRRILSGDLAAGQRISEQALAKDLGVSRTPVRSAIRELESEGLVEQVPRFGTIVKRLDRRDLAELYEMRVALEGFAANLAADRILPEDLEALASLIDEISSLVDEKLPEKQTDDPETIAQFVGADMQFHVIILRSTGNRRLMKSVADSRMLSQWSNFARTQHDLPTLAEIWDQHRRILDALESADADAARQAMIDHIRFSSNVALRVYDRLQAEGDAAEAMRWAPASFQGK